MPTIELDQIRLRTIHVTDAKDMFEYGRNPNVTRFLTWGPYSIEEEALETIKSVFYPRYKEKLPIGYAIVDVNTSKMIGTIDFHSRIKKENGAEIGFALHEDYWNKGIMSKCLKKMVEIGFDHLKYDFIRIKHLKQNVASQKVIEKAGFRLIKIEHYLFEKRKEVIDDDLLIYIMTKEDYYGN
jgi:ribosomal-protein-alanine N-acetyltransferase